MRDQYVASADCFVIAYSITSRSSFEEAKVMNDWILRIKDKQMPAVSEESVLRHICYTPNMQYII